jgi:osmoprotectant transport system permease protein
MTLLHFWRTHAAEFATLFGQHVLLVGASTLVAICAGVPIGILAARRPRAGAPIVWLANVVQTIPSLAMFGFLLPLPFVGGLGARVAIFVLILYALLPIVRTTTAGLRSIDRVLIEAGTAMGMTPAQLMREVELPLALPSIVAGIRVAAVIGVGTATIAAAIGAGGLGEYIFRGLAMVDTTTILAGAIPAAALALAADGALAWIERLMQRGRLTAGGAARVFAAIVLLVALVAAALYGTSRRETIVVGSKNFTEQVILGELVAQAIEREGGVDVVRKLNLGGTFVCDRGIRAGELDVYVEYTGTAVSAVFHQPVPRDPHDAFERARDLYASAGVTVLDPLGFNNTFAILVRSSDAHASGLRTIDDLRSAARGWTPGFGYEFLQRDDGYPGLVRTYGLEFGAQPRAMDLSLIYRALADRQVDVIAGDATSAMIDALQLTPLEDNRHYFPPYDAVPVARTASLLRHPAIGRAMKRLAARISDRDMRAMNAAVDLQHRDVRDVVTEFLRKLNH